MTRSLERDVYGWPCFREHSLYEAAVQEAARELQVSKEMAMMCAFGAMATACQGHVDVQMPNGRRVPASLMMLTIADSGERKTSTQNDFFEAIHALNNSKHLIYLESLKKLRSENLMWSARKRLLESNYRKSAADKNDAIKLKAEEELIAHLKEEPLPTPSGKFLYEDTTPQALVQMLYENTPNACLLTSEANSIFGGKALGELDKLNILWDGSSVIVDRISREGFILQNARLTLSLMAQPTVIHRFMGKRGNEARGTGFLARFLVVKPRSMAGSRKPKKSSDRPRKRAFNDRILSILKKENPPERQLLHFSESAAANWEKYSIALEEGMQENSLYYYAKDHASKLLENASRLAAILHTFERKSDDLTEIDEKTLRYCWIFTKKCSSHFMEYLCNEPQVVTDTNQLARYLMKKAYETSPPTTKIDHKLERIKEELRRTDYEINPSVPLPTHLRYGCRYKFSLTDIKQYGPSSLRGRANSERLDAAISLLIKLGHVRKNTPHYDFEENILLMTPPDMKNGEFITIKELPLYSEQEFIPVSGNPYEATGYFIISTT